eukprot:329943-Karenia_brevis.AAC.1
MFDARCFQEVVGAHAQAVHIQHFLHRIEFTRCRGSEEGTTWLELYIAYKLAGYACPLAYPHNKARARRTMRMQLKAFKAA